MTDPLAQVVGLLQPSASFSKLAEGKGAWRVRRMEVGQPFYCATLEGSCRLTVPGHDPITLQQHDFVLIPAAMDFSNASVEPPPADQPDSVPVELRPGLFRFGDSEGPPDIRMLVGYCAFGSTDASLLVSLLPRLMLVRGQPRLTTLVQQIAEEYRADRPGRAVVLARLAEVMLIEALRSTAGPAAPPGLLRGLDDERLAVALRRMHERPTWPWTVAELAKETALSRSSFFARFKRAVGLSPMDYLLHWRMALAKDLLGRDGGGMAEIARRVGYGSASAFSVAFTRHVGLPPTLYAREQAV